MKNNMPIDEELKSVKDEVSNLKDLDLLYNEYRKIINYIYNNKKLTVEWNLRANTFENMQKENEFKKQFKIFTDTLEVKKSSYPDVLSTDDVEKIFYFPTMGRMAVYPPSYDSVYPVSYNGVFELYHALQCINKVGIFPREVFENTKDCIDFYILKLLTDYIILPQHIGSVRPEEYCCAKTFYRIGNYRDDFLICWLRAVLLGVLDRLMSFSKASLDMKKNPPVYLKYYDETDCYKLDGKDFDLTYTEKEVLKEIVSPLQKQNKRQLSKHISNINKKAKKIIHDNIISCKNKEKLYRIDKKIVTYKD